MKHKDIIEKLNKLEKVAIVASALRKDPFERAGVPPVNLAKLDSRDDGELSYTAAARSWDPALVGRLTEEVIAKRGCKNNLFVAPDLKTAVAPSLDGLTEDAVLNGEIGAALIRSAHKVGAAIALADPSVDDEHIAYVDIEEDPSAVYELFVKPYVKASEGEPCDAVIIDPSRKGQGYYDTNRSLLNDVQNGLLGDDVFIVGEGETFTSDAVNMLRSRITLGGCTIPLERAVRRYSQLQAYEKEGSILYREVEEAIRNGSAIDDDTLDALVDDIIDFAMYLDGLEFVSPEQDKDVDEVAVAAVQADITEGDEINSEQGKEEVAQDSGVDKDTLSDEATTSDEEDNAQEKTSDVHSVEETVNSEDNVSGDDNVNSEDTVNDDTDNKDVINNAIDGDMAEGGFVGVDKADDEDKSAISHAEPVEKTIVAESIVLLKNNKLLPLQAGARVALIGDMLGDIAAYKEKLKVVGKAKGYDRTAQRSDTYIPAAVRATKNADAAIVFVYPDSSGKLALPANRLALLDALKNAGKRIIAVVAGDAPVDLGFDDGVDALLLAPESSPYLSEALAEILIGERDPSGRLTRTYYDNADEYYRKYLEDRNSKVMRIGSFVGYRRYGIEKVKVRYPFGYGLSYAEFAYSNLSISQDNISFTLTNTGERDGWEVVQVYVGAPDRLAPKKQLRKFRRIYLKRGESHRIVIPFADKDLETYDPKLYTDTVAAGEYKIYVGSSSKSTKLQGRRIVGGVKREADKYVPADFSDIGDYGDVSGVASEDRLTKKKNDLPKNLKLAHKVALYALPALAILCFVALSVYLMATAVDYFLLNSAEKQFVQQIIFLSAVGVLLLVPIFGSLNRKRLIRIRNLALLITPFLILALILFSVMYSGKLGGRKEGLILEALTCLAVGVPVLAIISAALERQLWKDKKGKNHWDKYYFEREKGEKITSDEVLERAIKRSAAEKKQKGVEKKVKNVWTADVPQFYDKRLDYPKMLADCRQFLKESGFEVEESVLVDYIAAICSTQLVVIPKGDGAELCRAIAEYFGRKAYIDAAEEYTRPDDLLVKWYAGGYAGSPTSLAVALERAAQETAYLHTVILRHIDKNAVEMLLEPIADVLARRRLALSVGERSVAIPANVVIFAEIESQSVVLNERIAEVAAVISPECEQVEPAERRTIVQTVGFERISAMSAAVRDECPLDEEMWKNIDALEERCGRIGNNIWNRIELHSSVAAACGVEQTDAMDGAIAAELLPWLKTAWDSEGSPIDAIKDIFGEERAAKFAAILEKNFGEDK